jgi:hypothetical protein
LLTEGRERDIGGKRQRRKETEEERDRGGKRQRGKSGRTKRDGGKTWEGDGWKETDGERYGEQKRQRW